MVMWDMLAVVVIVLSIAFAKGNQDIAPATVILFFIFVKLCEIFKCLNKNTDNDKANKENEKKQE